jgi:hypothetical protein
MTEGSSIIDSCGCLLLLLALCVCAPVLVLRFDLDLLIGSDLDFHSLRNTFCVQ